LAIFFNPQISPRAGRKTQPSHATELTGAGFHKAAGLTEEFSLPGFLSARPDGQNPSGEIIGAKKPEKRPVQFAERLVRHGSMAEAPLRRSDNGQE